FQKWATSFIDAAKRRNGVPDGNIIYLSEKPDAAGRRSTREHVEKAFAQLADRAKPPDGVFVVLIGHDKANRQQAMFNLPEPDLTAADYAKHVEKMPATRLGFINTASSSGGFLAALAGPGRTVVTATKTGGEYNETRFPEYFVEAYTGTDADKDHDGRV